MAITVGKTYAACINRRNVVVRVVEVLPGPSGYFSDRCRVLNLHSGRRMVMRACRLLREAPAPADALERVPPRKLPLPPGWVIKRQDTMAVWSRLRRNWSGSQLCSDDAYFRHDIALAVAADLTEATGVMVGLQKFLGDGKVIQ